ncbi:MAG: RluA family pseudouridine synthase [Christensenellales bacterium]
MKILFFKAENGNNTRLDVFIAGATDDLSRAHALKLIEAGFAEVNGQLELKGKRIVKEGDEIVLKIPEPQPTELKAENITLDIVYQDEWLAVINKQQGLTVHPANNVYSGTLVNALLWHLKDLSGINGDLRPGIVHRLDKDTSGLMVVAKNDAAHTELSRQIAAKECRRIYWALLEGVVKEDSGRVDKPIGRSPKDRKLMALRPDGRSAVTLYRVLERFEKNTLAEFELKTGRTHQIRVHAKFLGHPVVGDKAYGYKNQRFKLDGQLLHAKRLEFKHPHTGETMSFESDLPEYFKKVLNLLA